MAVKQLFDEIRLELFKVIVLNAFLDAVLVFLVAFLLLNVVGLGLLPALVVAGVFFLADVWRYARRLSYKYVEERNPELREMLRTAADNREDDGLMAHALFAELIQRMRKVSSGTFLDFRKLGFKLAGMFAISLVLVTLAFFNVNIQKFEAPFAQAVGRASGLLGEVFGDADLSDPGVDEADEGLYGEPSLARLGGEQLDLQLQQSLNQLDFSKVEDPASAGRDAPPGYEVEVSAQASDAFTGGLQDVSERKTAADYSQEIKR